MMFKNRRLLIVVLLLMLLLGGLGVNLFFKSAIAAEIASLPKRLQLVSDIYQIISNYYVDDVDSNKLIDGAIKGMVGQLDPYTTYLDPDQYKDMQTDLLDGVFGGIGIVITVKDDKLTIVSPMKGTPGEKVGLQGGDLILEVDGKSTKGISSDTAVKWMRGTAGTKVKLKIQRGEKEPQEFVITRAMIEVPFTDYKMRSDKLGYISISEFGQGVGKSVSKAMEDLHARGAKGIILDLRNNPGGLLTEAVNVSSLFIDKGPVVHVKSRDGQKETMQVSRFIKHYRLPLVVLVNGGSASASEIVAGALQDTNAGTLLGTKTFGKGTVQQVIPLSDGSAVKVTIARYYTPKERFIHENGLVPDIVLELNQEQAKKGIDNQLDKAAEILLQKVSEMKPAS